jgi:hypothetical protein
MLGAVTGCLPFTVSGLAEILTIVVVPVWLGFLISRWWASAPRQFVLAVVLPLFGALFRLFVTSMLGGSNWFSSLFRAISAVGFSNPYVWQQVLTLTFPVFLTVVTTVILKLLPEEGTCVIRRTSRLHRTPR